MVHGNGVSRFGAASWCSVLRCWATTSSESSSIQGGLLGDHLLDGAWRRVMESKIGLPKIQVVFFEGTCIFFWCFWGEIGIMFFCLKVRPFRGVMNIDCFFVTFVCSLKYFSGKTCMVFGVQLLSQSFVVVWLHVCSTHEFYTRHWVDRKSYLPGKSHVTYLYYIDAEMHSIRSIDNFTQGLRKRHILEI